ncbi:hypothetical protein [Paraburkholderia sp.]|uniref:hypothetical protein n=1 Tax=Paraburkholderia sp. TaxID=1926495 RepID=UPI003D6E3626
MTFGREWLSCRATGHRSRAFYLVKLSTFCIDPVDPHRFCNWIPLQGNPDVKAVAKAGIETPSKSRLPVIHTPGKTRRFIAAALPALGIAAVVVVPVGWLLLHGSHGGEGTYRQVEKINVAVHPAHISPDGAGEPSKTPARVVDSERKNQIATSLTRTSSIPPKEQPGKIVWKADQKIRHINGRRVDNQQHVADRNAHPLSDGPGSRSHDPVDVDLLAVQLAPHQSIDEPYVERRPRQMAVAAAAVDWQSALSHRRLTEIPDQFIH